MNQRERDLWTQRYNAMRNAILVKVRVPVNKYHAQRVEVDGILFDSKKEARRYGELKLLQAAGVIRQLETQPAYPLVVAELIGEWPAQVFETIGEYRPDFRYRLVETDAVVVEDVKSIATKTALYRLKKKFVEAQYRIVVVEIE